jgi:predicted nuclease with TOPRIM domain
MNYNDCINKIENNMNILNECHDKLLNKANEIKVKIDMLNKKMNISDTMPLLTFQNKIIHNELFYLNNMKSIIVSIAI